MADKIVRRGKVEGQGKLELISTIKLKNNDEFYQVVDFLNRNLKKYNLMFGMTKKGDEMIFSIYEV
ncbi:MAG: YpmA family protein [Firmicutes bacterium]|nr:YpmA family protein [Bacillota bacterium]